MTRVNREGAKHRYDHIFTSYEIQRLYIFYLQDFLTRFAKSEIGAQILLQCGLTSKLIECEFIDHRPDDSNLALHLTSFAYSQHYDPLSPSKMEQYRIVLSAVLRLIKAIVSSLGPGHQEFISQVSYLIYQVYFYIYFFK